MTIQAAPAEALRVRLTHGSTRFWVLVATTLVWAGLIKSLVKSPIPA
ncbi:MAG: hypothetical protein ACKOOH_03825 [Cyanobium sp.]